MFLVKNTVLTGEKYCFDGAKVRQNGLSAKIFSANSPFFSAKYLCSYQAAVFFSSFLMARLMKSLIVVPVAATIAAMRE